MYQISLGHCNKLFAIELYCLQCHFPAKLCLSLFPLPFHQLHNSLTAWSSQNTMQCSNCVRTTVTTILMRQLLSTADFGFLGGMALAQAIAIPPIATHFCLSVICHIRAPCLNCLTDLAVTPFGRPVHYRGPMTASDTL